MNFSRDVVDAAPPHQRALVELKRDGARREWSFGEVARPQRARSPGPLAARGVNRGDVVMTLIGNRPEWVLTMVACFRIGAVALPCNEQLRAKDLKLAARRRTAEAGRLPTSATLGELRRPRLRADPVPDESLFDAAEPAPAVELEPTIRA